MMSLLPGTKENKRRIPIASSSYMRFRMGTVSDACVLKYVAVKTAHQGYFLSKKVELAKQFLLEVLGR
jgi:hypothetical protein